MANSGKPFSMFEPKYECRWNKRPPVFPPKVQAVLDAARELTADTRLFTAEQRLAVEYADHCRKLKKALADLDAPAMYEFRLRIAAPPNSVIHSVQVRDSRDPFADPQTAEVLSVEKIGPYPPMPKT